MPTLKEKVFSDLKDAMKQGDEIKKTTLRMLLAEITRAEIAERKKDAGLDNESLLQVVRRSVKMREEAAESYAKAGRSELAEKERKEKDVLLQYLPPQLSDEELRVIAENAIKELNSTGPEAQGKVMQYVMKEVRGRADGARARDIVAGLLGPEAS